MLYENYTNYTYIHIYIHVDMYIHTRIYVLYFKSLHRMHVVWACVHMGRGRAQSEAKGLSSRLLELPVEDCIQTGPAVDSKKVGTWI